jgi:hypothetical protein
VRKKQRRNEQEGNQMKKKTKNNRKAAMKKEGMKMQVTVERLACSYQLTTATHLANGGHPIEAYMALRMVIDSALVCYPKEVKELEVVMRKGGLLEGRMPH